MRLARRRRTFVASTGSATQRFTPGSRSTGGDGVRRSTVSSAEGRKPAVEGAVGGVDVRGVDVEGFAEKD